MNDYNALAQALREPLKPFFVSQDVSPVGIFARVYRSTAQSIPNTALTAVSLDTERYDTDGLWDISNPTRLICTRAGSYCAWGNLRYAFNATGLRAAQLRYNGSLIVGSTAFAASATDVVDIQVTSGPPLVLAVGDYLELMAYQTSGAALSITTFQASGIEFGMQRIA